MHTHREIILFRKTTSVDAITMREHSEDFALVTTTAHKSHSIEHSRDRGGRKRRRRYGNL